MARLIITSLLFVQCFFRLKNISTYHSSFDFLSFLGGRQGRWYDPILQKKVKSDGIKENVSS